MITGASRGIGRAMASRLARDGRAVLVNNAGSTFKAERAVPEIQAAGGRGRTWTDHARAATGTYGAFSDAARWGPGRPASRPMAPGPGCPQRSGARWHGADHL
jgi:NAD(P)-dependent dehydrogenase (short-subunit alcohol dehydrogenase family)